MRVKHRTARSSVAETIDHSFGNATQELVTSIEIAIIEDGGGELSEANRQKVLRGAVIAVEGLKQAKALVEAAGEVLKGRPASELHTTTALEVAQRYNER